MTEGLEWDALLETVIQKRDSKRVEYLETGMPGTAGQVLAYANVAGLMDFELYSGYPDGLSGWMRENLPHVRREDAPPGD